MSMGQRECPHLWPAATFGTVTRLAVCRRCGATVGPSVDLAPVPAALTYSPRLRPVVTTYDGVIDFRRRADRWGRFGWGWSAGGTQDAVDPSSSFDPDPPQAA